MPIHDYVIDNQTGAAFRADLNNALAATVTLNSSATAPTTTYAYMLWSDTTAGELKQRNSANNGWVSIGTLGSANLGLLTSATAASTYAPINNPTFTGTVTIPANAVISGYLTSSTAASTYAPLASPTFTGDVMINGQGDLRFADSDSSHWVAFQAPATITTNVTWTLPSADGTSGQALNTDGSGVLSWASYAALATAQTFTAAQRGTISALGALSAGTTTLDFATANNFSLSLPAGGTVTLATPSNITAGQSGCVVITQNGTTAATVAYSTAWKWQGGAPSVSTTLSSVNVIAYFVESASRITAQLLTNTVN